MHLWRSSPAYQSVPSARYRGCCTTGWGTWSGGANSYPGRSLWGWWGTLSGVRLLRQKPMYLKTSWKKTSYWVTWLFVCRPPRFLCLTRVDTWTVAGCADAGPPRSAAGGGIAGVMPEVGREGWGYPGTEVKAGGWGADEVKRYAGGQVGPGGGSCLTVAALGGTWGSPWAVGPEDLAGSAGKR